MACNSEDPQGSTNETSGQSGRPAGESSTPQPAELLPTTSLFDWIRGDRVSNPNLRQFYV